MRLQMCTDFSLCAWSPFPVTERSFDAVWAVEHGVRELGASGRSGPGSLPGFLNLGGPGNWRLYLSVQCGPAGVRAHEAFQPCGEDTGFT